MSIIFKYQKFSLRVLLSIYLIFCQFQPCVAYKSVTYKSVTYKSVSYKSVAYKSVAYKSVTYTIVTYKSVIIKVLLISVTYKSVTYKSVTYKKACINLRKYLRHLTELIKTFSTNDPLLSPLKTSENLQFLMFSGGKWNISWKWVK